MALNRVFDTIITGKLDTKINQCGHCKKRAHCIVIEKIELPPNITPLISFILYHLEPGTVSNVNCMPLKYIGVTCGCYAKAHRQIAHITTNRKARRER